MSDFIDKYPESSIKNLYQTRHREWSRTQITDFIKALKECVDNGKRPPDHWIQLASYLLNDAAEAASEPGSKRRPVAIMKVLGLAGKEDTHKRDFLITTAMRWLMMDEHTQSERAAAVTLAEELLQEQGIDIKEEALRSIYHRMMSIGTGMAFTEHINEVLQATEVNYTDPEIELYNLEAIAQLCNEE